MNKIYTIIELNYNSYDESINLHPNSIGSINVETGAISFVAGIMVEQHIFNLNLIGYKAEGGTIAVRWQYLRQELIRQAEEYINSLYLRNAGSDYSNMEVFSSLQQIQFTVDGNDVFSNICLLIDEMLTGTGEDRDMAEAVLMLYADSVMLTEEMISDLIDLLKERYDAANDGDAGRVIERVERVMVRNCVA